MRPDKETEKRIMRLSGMVPIRAGTGSRRLNQAMAPGRPRVIVVEGDAEKLRRARAASDAWPIRQPRPKGVPKMYSMVLIARARYAQGKASIVTRCFASAAAALDAVLNDARLLT